jgi:sugar phosphate isomerase/epimerase
MRLSCLPRSRFARIARGDMTLNDWFRFAAELGLDGVECSPMFLPPLGTTSHLDFRRGAESHGLAVSNFTCYSDFTQPDPAAREREVAAMFANALAAKEMGSPTVRALTGQQWPGVGRREGITWVVEAIRRVCAEADRLGVKVVIENHTQAFTWKYFDFAMQGEVLLEILDLLRDTSVGIQFDTGNPLVAGEDPLILFEKLQDRIAYVHLNDVPRPGVFEFAAVGSGIAPNREVLSRLKRRGFDGWVGIEEASVGDDASYRGAVRYARAAWETG